MIGAAITLYELVPTDNVVVGHGYGDPASLSFGTATDFASTTDPVRADLGLAGIIGWTQPAAAAVDPTVVVPGYGLGTAQPAVIPPTTDIPCDLTSKTINASCSQIKTHRIVPVNSEGAAIDTQGVGLMFVIEDQAGFDIETGTAIQNPPVDDPLLAAGDVGSEVRFTSQAANDVPGEYGFAVRDVVSNSPICFGVLIVSYVPKVGNPTETADTKGVCIRIGNQQDGTAIEGATVRVTEDVDGLIQVAAFVTGADGIVDIKVAAAGTYYAHASKAGFAIGGPIEFTVV